jgi:hypothetical protein
MGPAWNATGCTRTGGRGFLTGLVSTISVNGEGLLDILFRSRSAPYIVTLSSGDK